MFLWLKPVASAARRVRSVRCISACGVRLQPQVRWAHKAKAQRLLPETPKGQAVIQHTFPYREALLESAHAKSVLDSQLQVCNSVEGATIVYAEDTTPAHGRHGQCRPDFRPCEA